MFSLDNAAFVFSASALAIALILAGLMMVTGNKKSAEDMQDQLYRSSNTLKATDEVTSTAPTSPAENELDVPEELGADTGSSGAVRVSFTVVSSEQQADE